jgi:hypothetical protein
MIYRVELRNGVYQERVLSIGLSVSGICVTIGKEGRTITSETTFEEHFNDCTSWCWRHPNEMGEAVSMYTQLPESTHCGPSSNRNLLLLAQLLRFDDQKLKSDFLCPFLQSLDQPSMRLSSQSPTTTLPRYIRD